MKIEIPEPKLKIGDKVKIAHPEHFPWVVVDEDEILEVTLALLAISVDENGYEFGEWYYSITSKSWTCGGTSYESLEII